MTIQGILYSIQTIGDTTYVNGYNSRTGSNWSQESMHIGSTTYTNGRAANGNSWDMTPPKNWRYHFNEWKKFSRAIICSKTCKPIWMLLNHLHNLWIFSSLIENI